jgi:hypothetical protein
MSVLNPEVEAYLNAIASPARRRDAEALIDVMRQATGEEPRMWKTIVGFGAYHYKYASGREGDAPAAGFAARKAATTVYLLDGVDVHAELLERLGPHTTGVGCLYIKRLDDIDLEGLEAVVARSYKRLTAGVFTNRAGDPGGA